MHAHVAFGTHTFVKRLVAASVAEKQAEAHVELLVVILESGLSTKADMAQVEVRILELKRDMKEMDAGLKRDLKEMDGKIDIRIKELETNLGTAGAIIGILFALMRLMPMTH